MDEGMVSSEVAAVLERVRSLSDKAFHRTLTEIGEIALRVWFPVR